MRKPAEFTAHPSSYIAAREREFFRVHITHITDGDTFDCFIDLGMGQYAYETIRLFDADTPELYSSINSAERTHALQAKARVAELILNRGCLIKTYKDKETFGRYVAELKYPMYEVSGAVVWIDLASMLKAEGLTRRESYV